MSTPGALAIQLVRSDGRELGPPSSGPGGTASARLSSTKGLRLFQEFQAENSLLGPWNPAVAECVAGLEFVAFLRPGTLLVAGSQLHLECLRGAHARGLLRPPSGYAIQSIGDIGERSMGCGGSSGEAGGSARFYPLAEALCSLIGGLNALGHPATIHSLHKGLARRFHQASTPPLEAVEKTLSWLLSEGRLYCMGSHYFLATPEMYAQFQAQKALIAQGGWTNSLPREKQGCSREIETQTGESIVMGMPAYRPKKDAASSAKPTATTATATTATQVKQSANHQTKEKHGGFFRRLFRRSKSRETLHVTEKVAEGGAKGEVKPAPTQPQQMPAQPAPLPLSTFAAQFPPTEWLPDPATFRVPKTRRVRDKKERVPVSGSVWIDLEPGCALPPRRKANDPKMVSGRFPSAHEELSSKAERRAPPRRLHKYLSSSSEALHPISTPAHHHRREAANERRRHRRSHHPSHTPTRENGKAPLAIPTTTELDTTLDQPQPSSSDHQCQHAGETQTKGESGNRISDSALSASPVVTEMSSSSSAKFSSWSGSEGTHRRGLPDPSYVNLPSHRIPEEPPMSEERMPSPIGRPPRALPGDATYENVGLESTKFESLSLAAGEEEDDDDPVLAADASLDLPIHTNYISAL